MWGICKDIRPHLEFSRELILEECHVENLAEGMYNQR